MLNALSSLWHPTQILADLLTLHEHAHLFTPAALAAAPDPSEDYSGPNPWVSGSGSQDSSAQNSNGEGENDGGLNGLPPLPSLTIAYVGDSANVLHDMLVSLPRLGHALRVASPATPSQLTESHPHGIYRAPKAVWDRVQALGCDKDGEGRKGIWWGEDPREAVRGADVVVTDTWCVCLHCLFSLSLLFPSTLPLPSPCLFLPFCLSHPLPYFPSPPALFLFADAHTQDIHGPRTRKSRAPRRLRLPLLSLLSIRLVPGHRTIMR